MEKEYYREKSLNNKIGFSNITIKYSKKIKAKSKYTATE